MDRIVWNALCMIGMLCKVSVECEIFWVVWNALCMLGMLCKVCVECEIFWIG